MGEKNRETRDEKRRTASILNFHCYVRRLFKQTNKKKDEFSPHEIIFKILLDDGNLPSSDNNKRVINRGIFNLCLTINSSSGP